MARLKAAWPDCRISWLINPEWSPLLAENPDIAEVLPFPRREFRGPGAGVNFVRWCLREVAGSRPDLALDFQGLLRTALVGRASRSDVLWGMSDSREGARWFYHRVAPMPVGVAHAVERYLALASGVLASVGSGNAATTPEGLRFPLPRGEAMPSLTGAFVLLHPFARGKGKSLTGPQITSFCERLAPRQVILVGRRATTEFVCPKSVVDLLEATSLPQLIWLIRQASCVVSVDSGPAHLAAALNKPMVAIHTWSDPRRVGPYRDDAWVWKNGRLLQMTQIRVQEERFFQGPFVPLQGADVATISDLATSLSDSCA